MAAPSGTWSWPPWANADEARRSVKNTPRRSNGLIMVTVMDEKGGRKKKAGRRSGLGRVGDKLGPAPGVAEGPTIGWLRVSIVKGTRGEQLLILHSVKHQSAMTSQTGDSTSQREKKLVHPSLHPILSTFLTTYHVLTKTADQPPRQHRITRIADSRTRISDSRDKVQITVCHLTLHDSLRLYYTTYLVALVALHSNTN